MRGQPRHRGRPVGEVGVEVRDRIAGPIQLGRQRQRLQQLLERTPLRGRQPRRARHDCAAAAATAVRARRNGWRRATPAGPAGTRRAGCRAAIAGTSGR